MQLVIGPLLTMERNLLEILRGRARAKLITFQRNFISRIRGNLIKFVLLMVKLTVPLFPIFSFFRPHRSFVQRVIN